MKENLRLKTFLIFSFLIFALPFFQTCSDKSIKENFCIEAEEEIEVETVGNIEINNIENIPKSENGISLAKKDFNNGNCLEEKRNEYTFNAYSLGFNYFNEFETKDFKDKTFYIFSIFTIIIFFTFIMLIFTFLKKLKFVRILSLINFVLALLWFILLFVFDFVDELSQIKYGYYLYVLILSLIIFETRKNLIKTAYNTGFA